MNDRRSNIQEHRTVNKIEGRKFDKHYKHRTTSTRPSQVWVSSLRNLIFCKTITAHYTGWLVECFVLKPYPTLRYPATVITLVEIQLSAIMPVMTGHKSLGRRSPKGVTRLSSSTVLLHVYIQRALSFHWRSGKSSKIMEAYVAFTYCS